MYVRRILMEAIEKEANNVNNRRETTLETSKFCPLRSSAGF